jgi:hypothetical protein
MCLSHIVDDYADFRKLASSSVVDQWGKVAAIPDHSLIHLIALGSFDRTGSNRNGDAFREKFLKTAHHSFVKNAHLYRNHKAFYMTPDDKRVFDPDLREGFVVKSAYNQDMGRVEVLVAARHDKCADWLTDLERGRQVAFSMGFDCVKDECSVCKNEAPTPETYCQHVKKNASHPYGMNKILPDGRKCFVWNDHGQFSDISKVGVGADMIAFDLRKVASLANSEETVSGAELAKMYERLNGTSPCARKQALANKLSQMEKRISAVGMIVADDDEEMIPDATAKKLARAQSSGELFSWLSSNSIVLPVRSFFKVAMPDEQNSDSIDKIARKLAQSGGGFAWAEDSGLLEAICSIESYTPTKTATNLLDHRESSELVGMFSMDPRVSDGRIQSRSIKIASMARGRHIEETLTPAETALACEYLAYKLAAITGCSSVSGESSIVDSLFSI